MPTRSPHCYYTVGVMASSDRRRRRDDPVVRKLGQAQADVLNVFWRRARGATVPELHAEINKGRAKKHGAALAYTTVLTVVQRLHARGLLEREAEGRGFRYRARQSRDELLAEWSDALIDQLLSDYGEIAVARLDERLRELDSSQAERL